MKKVIKDIFSKLTFSFLKNYKKFVANFHDKTNYVLHLRNLKQALNHKLILKN